MVFTEFTPCTRISSKNLFSSELQWCFVYVWQEPLAPYPRDSPRDKDLYDNDRHSSNCVTLKWQHKLWGDKQVIELSWVNQQGSTKAPAQNFERRILNALLKETRKNVLVQSGDLPQIMLSENLHNLLFSFHLKLFRTQEEFSKHHFCFSPYKENAW